MKGVAFIFPEGMPRVTFADEASAENFHTALHDEHGLPFRPMLVIEGPPASGKTRLLRSGRRAWLPASVFETDGGDRITALDSEWLIKLLDGHLDPDFSTRFVLDGDGDLILEP
ncbi:MAG TPA: hypothetical protein PLA50_00930 [Bacteroidia bacterium]|nr:hypothetical protein [Bacteroidia bacterium]